MTVADLLEKRQKGIFTDDKILKCELIALDGMTGRSLFDTRRSKKETITKYYSGEIISLWADVRWCKSTFGDYVMPVMKCYVAHDSWETDEERNRRLCRENYAAQMKSLGYDVDGNKK